jgi:hypothetical protein
MVHLLLEPRLQKDLVVVEMVLKLLLVEVEMMVLW